MNDTSAPPLLIPYQMLDLETLDNLIEDFVTRDGTDNGDDTPLQRRKERALMALQKTEAVILFDPQSAQCQLVARHELPADFLQDKADDE